EYRSALGTRVKSPNFQVSPSGAACAGDGGGRNDWGRWLRESLHGGSANRVRESVWVPSATGWHVAIGRWIIQPCIFMPTAGLTAEPRKLRNPPCTVIDARLLPWASPCPLRRA